MLALAIPLQQRLAALPQLTGWVVRTNTEAADRKPLPAVDVRCVGAAVADSKTGAAMVAPEWAVTLMVRRGDDASSLLDAALSAVICSLHGWAPGQHGGAAGSRWPWPACKSPPSPTKAWSATN